ncbi:MAG: UDP-N-acetylmuramoyl-tripeptide--D-alanyl-D-alanine ligase [Anaerolineaceae bacterium]
MLTLQHILTALTGHRIGETDFSISGACIDSRSAERGTLFIALKGENTDGHLYVDAAFANGAVLAIIDHPVNSEYPIVDLRQVPMELPAEAPFSLLTNNSLEALQKLAAYWRNQFDIKVVGITGSVGKSSTKDLTASVLSRRLVTLKNAGNMNNEIGLPLTLLKLNEDHEVAVLEMGFYVPGEISQLSQIARPQIGVVTNVGTVHAERAGSIEVIAQGKAELVQTLPPAPEGVAILNHDDEWVRAMANQTRAKVLFYGLSPEADLWADEIVSMGLEGIRCRIHYQGEELYVTAPLIGRHSVYTMLRSAAVALSLGITWDWIFHAFKTSKVQLRIVTVKTASGALLIDDTYNASPESTLAALNLLDDLEGRKVAVLGDMLELGQYEEDGHQRVGIRAAEVANEIVLVGPRSLVTKNAALENGFEPVRIHWFAEAEPAIMYLQSALHSGDIVLVKGSHAMRMDQIVASLEEPA